MAAAMPCKRAFAQASIRETVVSKTAEEAKASEAKTRFSCIAKHMNPREKESSQSGRGFMKSTLQRRERTLHCIPI